MKAMRPVIASNGIPYLIMRLIESQIGGRKGLNRALPFFDFWQLDHFNQKVVLNDWMLQIELTPVTITNQRN